MATWSLMQVTPAFQDFLSLDTGSGLVSFSDYPFQASASSRIRFT